MKGSIIVLIGIMMTLAGCSGSRALPEEWPLFPDTATGKWWLVNAVATDESGKDLHLCLLLSFTPASGKYYTTFYTSLWRESDSSYFAGMRSTDGPFSQEKRHFPVLLEIPAKDSTELEWYWTLGRKRMRLQCEVKNTAGEVYPLTITMSAPNRSTFKPFEMIAAPDTRSILPRAAAIRLTQPRKYKANGLVSMHVISAGESLIERTRDRYISWLDLYLNNGQYLSILYETDGKAYFRNLGFNSWDTNGKLLMLPEPQFHADTSQIWTSPASGKTYPLSLSVDFPEGDLFLKLYPRKVQQENGSGKNALWMGAVEAVDTVTGAISGKGNMYILKQ